MTIFGFYELWLKIRFKIVGKFITHPVTIFIFSILASLVIWGYMISVKFAVILIISIFIHEYGHYYWMGLEGIKHRAMVFLPPFGAVAMAKEPWPTRGAEARIALAGPAFGVLSVLLFYALWRYYQSNLFAASIILASFINLANLAAPISILDGGRIIKSILFSFSTRLGELFYSLSFLVLGLLFISGSVSIFLVLFLVYLVWKDREDYFSSTTQLSYINQVLGEFNEVRGKFPDGPEKNLVLFVKETSLRSIGYRDLDDLKDTQEWLSRIVNLPPMNNREIVVSLSCFAGLIVFYSSMLLYMKESANIDILNIAQHFK